MSNYRRVRQAAGWPLIKAAVKAGVSEPTARLFEKGGADAIASEAKRAALLATYAELEKHPKAA